MVRPLVAVAMNETAASHAALPIARDQLISPSEGRTSGVERPGGSRNPRLAQIMWA